MQESTKLTLDAEVVARLRASEAHSETVDWQFGRAAGQRWAELQAEVSELRALWKEADSRIQNSEDWTSDAAFDVIHKHASATRNEREDFWMMKSDEAAPSDRFVEGFVDGALDVLDAYDSACSDCCSL